MGFEVELAEGAAAAARIADPAFEAAWRALAAKDPRITVFQEPEFCRAWYASSAATDDPLLLTAREGDALVGLLALSRVRGTDRVRHAGAHQAIYDGWLAEPALESEVAAAFVERVFEHVRPRRWLWRYLPPGSRVTWALRQGATRAPLAARLSTMLVPLWDFADDEFLKKKTRHKRLRNYANRYKKEGDFALERVTDADRATRAVDTLVTWVDFRQGAVHASLPFRDDPGKRDFYRRLARAKGTRVTLLRVDEKPLAIQLDAEDHAQLCLCLHGYDPAEGQRSPGMLLLTQLAEQAAAEGLVRIDMSPGDDPWKEDYTNARIECHRVEFFRAPEDSAIEETKQSLSRRAAATLRELGRDPRELMSRARTARAALRGIGGTLRGRLSGRDAIAAFDLPSSATPRAVPLDSAIAMEAMLTLDATERREDLQRVLFDGLKRFERGWQPFIHKDRAGAVDLVAWAATPPVAGVAPPPALGLPWEIEAPGAEAVRALDVPEDVGVLVVSFERDAEDVEAALAPALEHLAAAGARRVYLVLPPDAAAGWSYAERRGARLL